MGVVENVGSDQMPRQGDYLNHPCIVVFKYDNSREFFGTIVRDDMEAPFRTIIRLDDGRTVLATECQYSPLAPSKANRRAALRTLPFEWSR